MKRRKSSLEITGMVSQGLGRGGHFVGKEGYASQILRNFAFMPYPGTLNLIVSEKGSLKVRSLMRHRGILINGFSEGEKTFGDVTAYRSELKGLSCAVLFPKLSKEKGKLEVISDRNLRMALGLKEGQSVTILIFAS